MNLRIKAVMISVILIIPATLTADTLVAVLEPVSLTEPNEFDLGGTITGITDVTMRVTGFGGARCYSCPNFDGTSYQVLYDFEYSVVMDDSYLAFYRPGFGAYDFDVDVVLMSGVPDWSGLEDGMATLTVDRDIYESPPPSCGPGLFCHEPSEFHRLELTITAESVVPAAVISWGRIKALYR